MMMAGQNDDGACLAHGSYGAVHHVNAKLGYYVNDLSAKDGKRSWRLLMEIHKAALSAAQLLICVTLVRAAAQYTRYALSAKSFSLCCWFDKKHSGRIAMENIGKLAESAFEHIALEEMSCAKDVNDCEHKRQRGVSLRHAG